MTRFAVFALSAVVLHQCFATRTATQCDVEFRCHDLILNQRINSQISTELMGHYTYLYMAQLFDHHSRNLPKVAKYFRAKSGEELSHAERFIQYQNQRGGTVEMTGATIYRDGNCATIDTVMQAFQCAMELEAKVTKALTQLHKDASELKLNRVKGTPAICAGTIEDDDLRLTQPILVTVARTKGGVESETKTSDYTKCLCDDQETNCYVVSYSYVELADMITHEFLDHQLEDTKEIANYYNTLKRMYGTKTKAPLESWLFDKHLEL